MVKLMQAKVFHKRTTPQNIFCYKAGYILIPLLGKFKNPKFFAINKFDVFSFYNKDHGKRNNTRAIDWALQMLEYAGIQENTVAEIALLTHPRCLGFVFNPVSFYFCLSSENNLLAVIAEVNNTFGQTHSYIIHEANYTPIVPSKKYTTPKEFFVSPFFQIEGHYEFRFSYTQDKIAVFIDYFTNNLLAFETSLIGNVVEFTPRNALPYVFTTFKTVFLIGIQALILKFIKKLKFRKPPTQTPNHY
jgi:DUF1365 family protein